MEKSMKQKKKDSEPVLYISTFSNARIAFDGIAKESKHGVLPYRAEKFKDGKLWINPDEDYGDRKGLGREIIKRMESHPQNRSNGGNLFYKVDQNARDVMEFEQGTLVAREPSGGITKSLQTQLEELYRAIDGYDKEAHDILVDEIGVVFDTFSVKGLLKPQKDYDQLRVRARLIDFFGILKERDIWEPPEPKAKK
jgi:hypothetical protein